MLKLCNFTKVKVFFLVLVYVFNFTNFNLFEFSAAILEKGLLNTLIVFTGLTLVRRYTIKYNFHGYLAKMMEKASCSAGQPLATWTNENRIIVSCTRGFVVITSRQFPSSLCLCFKTCLVPNHSYEKDFDFHKRQHIGGTHCQVNGFALELALTQKRNSTRKLMGHFVSLTTFIQQHLFQCSHLSTWYYLKIQV